MLKLIDVEAGYGPIPVLHGINMEIGRGEIITLIGAHGAGKTTTLMAVCGLIPPPKGLPGAGRPPDLSRPDGC